MSGAVRVGVSAFDPSKTRVSCLCPFLNLGSSAKRYGLSPDRCPGKASHSTGRKKKSLSRVIALYFNC